MDRQPASGQASGEVLYSCQLKSQSTGGGASSRHAVHPTGMCGWVRLSDVRVMSHRGVSEVHVKLLQAPLAWFEEGDLIRTWMRGMPGIM